MSDARANIVISANPSNAQAGLKSVKGSLADLEQQSKKLMGEFRNLAKGTKEFGDKAKELQDLNKRIRDLKDSVGGLAEKARATTLATQAMGSALGFLGVNSVQAVVTKMISLGQESVRLAINLEGVLARSEALFGTAFPSMAGATEALAQKLNRSSSELLEFTTGFGSLLDSMGLASGQVRNLSLSLAELTSVLGKAFPDKADVEIYSILEAAIQGNVRGLRQLGIAMNDDLLQAYADTHLATTTKVKDMDAEQQAALRALFLQEQTIKLQDAAAKSTGKYTDQLKSFKGEWQDLLELVGKPIGMAAAFGLQTLTETVKGMVGPLQTAIGLLRQLGQLTGVVQKDYRGATLQALGDRKLTIEDVNADWAQDAADATKQSGFWNLRPGMGGGGGGKTAEQLANELEAAEERILTAMGQQARVQLETVRTRREDLKLRERLGTLTKDETRELTQINRRIAFKKDLLDEATKAWEEQVKMIERAEDRVKALTEKITDEQKSLKDTLADIGKDFGERRTGTIADLIGERNDLEGQLRRLEGLSPKEQERLRELEGILARLTPEERAAGKADAALDPLQKLEQEKQRRIREAQEKADARLAELQGELDTENQKLAALRSAEEQKKQAVLTALNERLTAVQTAYQMEEEATKQHVDRMILEFGRLSGGAKGTTSLKVPAFAEGGIVTRPTLALIGERGPEAVVPLGKSAGMGITIGKIEVHNQADEDRLIAKLTRLIQLQSLQAA